MNHTVQYLLKYVKNGVVATSTLKQMNMPLFKLLEANFDNLSQTLRIDYGVLVLRDDLPVLREDNQVALWLRHHYGKDFKLRATDKDTYNMIYYRARKQDLTVNQYLESLGFKPTDDHDFIHLIDKQKYSVREVSAMTGVPKSTVHRKYKQQKEEEEERSSAVLVSKFSCGELLIEVITNKDTKRRFIAIFEGTEELCSKSDHLKLLSHRQHAAEMLRYFMTSDELTPEQRQRLSDLAEYTGKRFEAQFIMEELK
jgi:hypothetical protein